MKATPSACDLVTAPEVAAIQEAPVTNANNSNVPDANFAAAQCYYNSSAPDKSVTVIVMQRDPTRVGKITPQAFWEKTFARGQEKQQDEAEEKLATSHGREENEHEAHPVKVENLGEETFWVDGKFGGVLYVLHNDCILRVSVGGPDSGEIKMQKFKAVAERALTRF